jgi:hypothetical protein
MILNGSSSDSLLLSGIETAFGGIDQVTGG